MPGLPGEDGAPGQKVAQFSNVWTGVRSSNLIESSAVFNFLLDIGFVSEQISKQISELDIECIAKPHGTDFIFLPLCFSSIRVSLGHQVLGDLKGLQELALKERRCFIH